MGPDICTKCGQLQKQLFSSFYCDCEDIYKSYVDYGINKKDNEIKICSHGVPQKYEGMPVKCNACEDNLVTEVSSTIGINFAKHRDDVVQKTFNQPKTFTTHNVIPDQSGLYMAPGLVLEDQLAPIEIKPEVQFFSGENSFSAYVFFIDDLPPVAWDRIYAQITEEFLPKLTKIMPNFKSLRNLSIQRVDTMGDLSHSSSIGIKAKWS